MLNTIINMGLAMDLTLVAEGVEDKATADLLTEMGVHYLQGFYFCAPRPDEGIREFLYTNNETNNVVSIVPKRNNN